VRCQSCGKEIADKAIVCYRCGTPTAIPEPSSPAARQRPDGGGAGRWHLIVLVLSVLVLGGLVWRGSTPAEYAAFGAAVVVAEAAVWWLARPPA
jgi:hypothetical protein